MLAVSVAICTHNRAGVLPRAVRAAIAEAAGRDAEVLVVDNASTDETANVCAELAREAGGVLRAVREDRLGLSAARNRALAEARGAVVAFLDDDAVPRPGWLAAVTDAFARDAVAVAGGPIRLHFPTPPPAWLSPELHAALTAYDLGTAPRRIHDAPAWEYPYGANVAFRVARARALGGFSPRFGHRGRRQHQHEETDLCLRLDRAGGHVVYRPDAVVDHWVLAERLTPGFFLRRHWQRGQSGALCEVRNRGLRPALKLLRWYHGPNLLRAPERRARDAERLLAACRRREAAGYVVGLLRAMVLDGAGRGAGAPAPRPEAAPS
jgi:glucosyl-dolichyl phosphate glucuronosyltransferase